MQIHVLLSCFCVSFSSLSSISVTLGERYLEPPSLNLSFSLFPSLRTDFLAVPRCLVSLCHSHRYSPRRRFTLGERYLDTIVEFLVFLLPSLHFLAVALFMQNHVLFYCFSLSFSSLLSIRSDWVSGI